jgi:hypothetical protein
MEEMAVSVDRCSAAFSLRNWRAVSMAVVTRSSLPGGRWRLPLKPMVQMRGKVKRPKVEFIAGRIDKVCITRAAFWK